MDVLGTEAAGTADNDPVTILLPFEDGARADAELSANVHGDRDLPLRGKLGVRDCHTSYYQGNGIGEKGRAAESRTNRLKIAYIINECDFERSGTSTLPLFCWRWPELCTSRVRPPSTFAPGSPSRFPSNSRSARCPRRSLRQGSIQSTSCWLESERRIEFTRLQCLLGTVDRQRVQTCANIAEAIDIDWAVLHNGQLAAAGSSKESSGGEYGDPMAREIGHFSAKRGERYSVVLYIHRNGGELSTTNPKLVVET